MAYLLPVLILETNIWASCPVKHLFTKYLHKSKKNSESKSKQKNNKETKERKRGREEERKRGREEERKRGREEERREEGGGRREEGGGRKYKYYIVMIRCGDARVRVAEACLQSRNTQSIQVPSIWCTSNIERRSNNELISYQENIY